ncbi:Alpha/Beta hydrolase protein [Aspergillus cavernicola]|uniref:Alpha/Beta hydrolase protein n=1 Tax=Aspergillus cavernicola TaxID=176166 RepID=A0ABR4HR03_9EURO
MSSLSISTSPDTTLHVRITRPKTNTRKPLLVFLHYWGGSSLTWYKLVFPDSTTTLSSEYPTAAIDLRGWGQSTGPTEDAAGASYSITTMASDIASVLSQLKSHAQNEDLLANGFVLVGHSMGAKVALATLSALPAADLLGALKGLVLVAPAPPTALVLPVEMKEQQKVAYETEDSVRWVATNVLSSVEHLSEGDLDIIVRDSLSGNPLAKAAWPAYGMGEDITDEVSGALLALSAAGIQVRVLAGELDVVERKDRVESEVCRFLEGSGVMVSFRVVPAVKHLLPLESPAAVWEEISHF